MIPGPLLLFAVLALYLYAGAPPIWISTQAPLWGSGPRSRRGGT